MFTQTCSTLLRININFDTPPPKRSGGKQSPRANFDVSSVKGSLKLISVGRKNCRPLRYTSLNLKAHKMPLTAPLKSVVLIFNLSSFAS